MGSKPKRVDKPLEVIKAQQKIERLLELLKKEPLPDDKTIKQEHERMLKEEKILAGMLKPVKGSSQRKPAKKVSKTSSRKKARSKNSRR